MTYDGPPVGAIVPDGYEFERMGRCTSCDAEYMWCRTRKGNMSPVNLTGVVHWATCPNAADHRRPKPPPRTVDEAEERGKQEGMDIAAIATADWQHVASRWVIAARPGTPIISDDVTAAIGVPPSQGAVGALFSGLARGGYLRDDGRTKSRRAGRHKSRVTAWRRTDKEGEPE